MSINVQQPPILGKPNICIFGQNNQLRTLIRHIIIIIAVSTHPIRTAQKIGKSILMLLV